MNIKFDMTVEQYNEYCVSFFENFNKDNLNEQIAQMSVVQYKEWFAKINEDYYEYYTPVQKLVKLIRGDYDYEDDTVDPLTEKDNKKFFTQYRETYNNVFESFFNSLPAYQQKLKDLEQHYIFEENERLLNIEVDGKTYRAIKAISVYWSGWECDTHAWLVKEGEEVRVVASNHGSLYFTDKSFLESKLEEYKKAMLETEDMLSMLQ